MSSRAESTSVLELLVDPLSQCLDRASAQRILQLRADARLTKAVDELAEKSNGGTLSTEEREQYEAYLSFGTFIALLKSKARLMLVHAPTEC